MFKIADMPDVDRPVGRTIGYLICIGDHEFRPYHGRRYCRLRNPSDVPIVVQEVGGATQIINSPVVRIVTTSASRYRNRPQNEQCGIGR